MRRLLILLVVAAACGDDGNTPIDAAPDATMIDGPGSPAMLVIVDANDQPVTSLVFPGAGVLGFDVLNQGGSPSEPLSISVTGSVAFSVDTASTTCAGPLAGGARCHVGVTFTSTGDDDVTGGAVVTAGVASQTVILRVAESRLAWTQPVYDAGLVGGGLTAMVDATLKNTGTLPVSVDSVMTSDPLFTLISSSCVVPLAPGDTCDVFVSYSPPAFGLSTATLHAAYGADDATATLTATGGMGLTVVAFSDSGFGGGTVTSTPAGLSCTDECYGAFATDVLLTATPDAGMQVDHWDGVDGCLTGATCHVPLAFSAMATAYFTPAGSGGITLLRSGPGTQSVRVEDATTGDEIFACNLSAAAPSCGSSLAPGTHARVLAATTEAYGGIAGACTDATGAGECEFVASAAGNLIQVASLPDPHFLYEQQGLTIGDATAAATDASGHLVVGRVDDLNRYTVDPVAGTTTFVSHGFGYTAAAIATATTVDLTYVVSTDGTELVALAGTPWSVAWHVTLDPALQGCVPGFAHCVATTPDGASIAVRGPNGVGVYDATGALVWSAPLASPVTSVAIGPDLVVYAPVPNAAATALDLQGFAVADGSAATSIPSACLGSTGTLQRDAQGLLVCASTGDGSAHLTRIDPATGPTWTVAFASDALPTDTASGPDASIVWYTQTAAGTAAVPYTIRRYAADGTGGDAVHVDPASGRGLTPIAITRDAAGNLYLFSQFWHVDFGFDGTETGIFQVFSP